jgi:hypothetical protein
MTPRNPAMLADDWRLAAPTKFKVLLSVALPVTAIVLENVAAPVTAMVFEKKVLPMIVVFVVLATMVVATLLPVIVSVENVLLALRVVLPVTVTTELTLNVPDVTFVVEDVMLRNTPLTLVFPLEGESVILLDVISTLENVELALNTTTLAPPKAKAVFVSRLRVLPTVRDPPPIPENATNVLAPNTPLT